jgi:predicted cupin superfamily sugar epimerase
MKFRQGDSRNIFIFIYFVLWPTNAQLFHKLSHSYMFRHYCIILRELVINTQVFQMQLLVIQFTINMFHIGFFIL